RDDRGDPARALGRPLRLSLPRRGRDAARRGRVRGLLVLARRVPGPRETGRRGYGPDGAARPRGERRRALLGGDRPGARRVPGQLPAGPVAPRADQRRRRDRGGHVVILWGSIAGGVVGTVVLTSALRVSQELGWTRMDLPLLLGTVFSDNRSRASVIG